MTDYPHRTRDIPIGTPVRAFDGSLFGTVREVHPHYLLVGQEGEHGHNDLEVPVHAIRGFTEGQLQVSVNRGAMTEADDVETAHQMGQE